MKKLLLLIILAFISIFNGYSQYGVDTITFEKHRELVRIDTSQKGNIWQIGTPHKTIFNSAYSKPYAIVTDTVGSYPINNTSSFIVIVPSNISSFGEWGGCNVPSVDFFERYNMDTLKDSGVVTISTDNGKTWVPLNTFCKTTASGYQFGSMVTGTNSGSWVERFIQFTPSNYCPTNQFPSCDTALLKFTFYSDSVNTNKEGWMIDNIALGWDFCESVEEYTKNTAQVSTYPNPASNQVALTYQLPAKQKSALLQLYNSVGQLVSKSQVNSNTTQTTEDVSSLPNGIYYYTLSVNGVVEATSKLVVIH